VVVLLPSSYVKRTLVGSLGIAQMLSDLPDESVQVLCVLFRRRTVVDGSLLGLPYPINPLDANALEPSRAHNSDGDFPRAGVELRNVRSGQEV